MPAVDQNKLSAVCALLEAPNPIHFRHYLALGADPYILSQNHDRIAGAAAAAYVRELARRLEEQFVQLGFVQQPAVVQVLDQQTQQLAVGVDLELGRGVGLASQCVEDTLPNV